MDTITPVFNAYRISVLDSEKPIYRLSVKYAELKDDYSEESNPFWEGYLPDGLHVRYWLNKIFIRIRIHKSADLKMDFSQCKGNLTVHRGAEWSLLSGCIIPMLAELLRRNQHYLIHAATLRLPFTNRGIVIAGAGGTGKTSTALALMHSGMELMSDDISFIMGGSPDTDPLRVWGFLPRLKIRKPTLTLLPWLDEYPRQKARMSGEFYIDLNSLRRDVNTDPVHITAVVFLGENNTIKHQLEPLDKTQAVELLIGENLRSTDHFTAKAFQTLVRFTGQCETYMLSASPELETLDKIIFPLMEN